MWNFFQLFKKKEKEEGAEKKEVRNRIITRNVVSNFRADLKDNKNIILKRNIRQLEKREVKDIDASLLNKKYKIDYKNSLNNEQLKALLSREGQYLVIAGAGSGKTRTIIYRTAFLLELGVSEDQILMVTFTRKATEEMKARLEDLLERKIKVEIETFHSFCMKLMEKNKMLFNLKRVSIVDDQIKEKIVKLIIRKNNIQLDIDRERVINIIEGLKKGKELKNLLNEIEKKEIKKLEFLIDEYRNYKKKNELFDFDDLIDRVLLKLKRDINFRKYLQERYRYIIVDEYQDTDRKQRDILKLVCGKNGNLMVVGDDYQSIYGFRGAEFENILRFNEDFPESYLIKLETNYRSTEEIVEYCNRIASKFSLKYNKISKSIDRHGKKPEIMKFKDENMQNVFILDKIKRFYNEGIPYSEMAVIYRNKYCVVKLEKLLLENGIPFKKREDEEKKREIGAEEKLQEDRGDKVSLISVHSSKGLEWRVVFIPTLLEGVFPSNLSGENLEEEKRLYYVACSRSKEYLYLLYPEYFYERLGYFDKKSSFLKIEKIKTINKTKHKHQ